jgi:hypothetical protein
MHFGGKLALVRHFVQGRTVPAFWITPQMTEKGDNPHICPFPKSPAFQEFQATKCPVIVYVQNRKLKSD